jgi:hypothetical protein
MLDC